MLQSFDGVKGFLSAVHVVHHIPGRLRLKINTRGLQKNSSYELPDEESVKKIVLGIEGIKKVKVNLLARSCTVEYDTTEIPDQAWTDFLNGHSTQYALLLDNKFRQAYNKLSHSHSHEL